jgi:predicted DNA-binding transcriptional regulator AlpA
MVRSCDFARAENFREEFILLGQKLLAFPELKAVKGISLSRRHIDRMEANGNFPVRVKVSERHVAWVEAEIDAHVAGLMKARPVRKEQTFH